MCAKDCTGFPYGIFAQVFLSIFHYILQAYSTTDIRVLGDLGQRVV
jgi:hypothetical protein